MPEPELVTPPGVAVADMRGRWFVAVAKAFTEPEYVADLLALRRFNGDVGWFYPQCRVTRYRDHRKPLASGKVRTYTERIVEWRALFTGYLFVNVPSVCGEDGRAVPAVETNPNLKPVRLIHVADGEQALLHRELTSLGIAMEQDPQSLQRGDVKIVRGQRVEVRRGRLQGTQGIVESLKAGKNVLILKVSILGKGVPMEVDADDVEVIDG